MHPDLAQALSRLDPAFAARLIAASDTITSPAQLFYVGWHLLHGNPVAAMIVATSPAGLYARYDGVMLMAWAMGKRRGEL